MVEVPKIEASFPQFKGQGVAWGNGGDRLSDQPLIFAQHFYFRDLLWRHSQQKNRSLEN